MTRSFIIPGRLIGLNDWTELCKRDRYESTSRYSPSSKYKRETEDMIAWCIKAARVKPVEGKVFIHITWIEPNMKRDLDNIDFAKKFIFDAMQKAGVIPNDNWRYIAGFDSKFRVNKSDPRIIVEIEEL